MYWAVVWEMYITKYIVSKHLQIFSCLKCIRHQLCVIPMFSAKMRRGI